MAVFSSIKFKGKIKMSDEKNQVKPESAPELRHLVRVLNTDLMGEKQVMYALTKIKGISIMLSNAICTKANIPKNKKTGYLNEREVAALESVITKPLSAGIPVWMLNRRSDPDTGVDHHLITSTLDFTHDMDIKKMKKTKSYKGLRHQWGQPVRGQRTKAHTRKNKGKGSLGVQKKKVGAPAAAPAKDAGKKGAKK
jgi:small subunit ribosomal protein S13